MTRAFAALLSIETDDAEVFEHGSRRWVHAICDPRAGAVAPVAANTKATAPREKPTANTSELQRTTANTGYKCLKYRTTEVGTTI